jgi:ABC-2 type transport system ATP-binding protein
MIEARHLSKRYRRRQAVDDLSFTVAPGQVTGFLGPNGAGKSTTMRLLLGLDRPDAGEARIGGRPYRDFRFPLRTAGALLEAQAVPPAAAPEATFAAWRRRTGCRPGAWTRSSR